MKKHFLKGVASFVLPLATYAAPSVIMGSYQRSSYLTAASRPNADFGLKDSIIRLQPATFSEHKVLSRELALISRPAVRELVVIDSAVPSKEVFAQQLEPGVDWVEITGGEDGLQQLQGLHFL